jgi:hypothetical protein
MNEAPAVEVHILDSRESSGGIEETAVSAVPPAVVNAIFAATGMRLRSLPVAPADLEQPACATHRGVCGTSPASSDRREEWQPVHLRGARYSAGYSATASRNGSVRVKARSKSTSLDVGRAKTVQHEKVTEPFSDRGRRHRNRLSAWDTSQTFSWSLDKPKRTPVRPATGQKGE